MQLVYSIDSLSKTVLLVCTHVYVLCLADISVLCIQSQ